MDRISLVVVALSLAIAGGCQGFLGDGDDGAGDGNDEAGDGMGSGGDGSVDPGSAQLCVEIINDYRATLDLPPLDRWADAEACSDAEAADDAASGVPHGAFGMCGESAQNECPGWPGPPAQLLEGCLAQMWAEGPGEDFSLHGHFINMSSPDYTRVACGFFETNDGSWWAVQNFQ